MRFRLLGACEVEAGNGPLDLGAPKQVALLARLLLDAPRPVSVDRLIDDLWAGDPPARATASLQAYVSNLRRVLEPDRAPRTPASVLVTRPQGYLLRVDPDDVDAVRFEADAARAAQLWASGDAAGAHDVAVGALGAWRGPALLDVREERFAAAAVARLEDLRLSTEEVRLGAALDLGRSAEVAAEAEALVAAEPLRERLWELLVLALYRGGRPAAALARYRRYRELLDAELGLEPGPGLQALELAVLRHDPALGGPALVAGADVIDLRPPAPAPTRPSSDPPASTPGFSAPGSSAPGVASQASGQPAAGPAAQADAGGVPLLGRDALLAALSPALAAAPPAWLLLTGEAGIGKTRLAEALADDARRRGGLVAVARAHEDPDTPPYWLWSQVLRGLGSAVPGAGVPGSGVPGSGVPGSGVPGAVAADGADVLGALADAASAGGAGDSGRFALFEGLRAALESAARDRPVLLVLDDLQWADGDSLRALRFLAVHLRDAAVALVATVRDGEGWPLFAEVMEHVARRPGARRVAVPPLDVDAVRALATALGGELGEDDAAALHERSGGNAFFATELARLAVLGSDAEGLPDGVRETVARRLARLPDSVRDALRLAAVVGAEADVAVLARAGGVDVADMLDLLDPALATGLLIEDGDGLRVRFGHALTREALLAELTPGARRRRHAQVAAALRGRGGGEPGAVSPGYGVAAGQFGADLAHHLLEAVPLGDPAAALEAATAQGRLAARRLAFEEAARWFGRALGVLPSVGLGEASRRRRHELLLARADALLHVGAVGRARQDLVAALLEAADGLPAHGVAAPGQGVVAAGAPLWGEAASGELSLAPGEAADVDLAAIAEAAAALAATGGVWTWVDLGEVPRDVLTSFEAVLARLRGQDSEAAVRLLGLVATGYYYADERELTDGLSAQAVAMARRLGSPALLADALLDRGFALRLPDHPAEVVALAEEALALPGLSGVQRMIAQGRRYYGLLHLGDLVEAEVACRHAQELADAERLRGPQLQLASFPVGMAAARGRFDEAEQLAARAWALAEVSDMPIAEIGLLGVGVGMAFYRGRLAELVPALRDAVRVTPLRALHFDLSLALAAAGDSSGAVDAWRSSASAPSAPWMEVIDACVEVDVLEALAPSGSELAAAPWVREVESRVLSVLEPRADSVAAAGTAFAWCSVAVPLGVLELRLGRVDSAVAHLRSGLARCQAWGTHVWTARAAWFLASALDAAGSSAEATALRTEALASAAELGVALPGR